MKATEPAKSITLVKDYSLTKLLRICLFRGFLFASIWWVLTNGVFSSWLIGVPAVAMATLASLVLLPASSWSLSGLLRFMPFFIWQSIRGGLDVASIALHPRLPLSPILYDYRLRLPTGLPRVFMANIVNLLPGTLSVDMDAEILRIHILNESGNHAEDLLRLEDLILDVVGRK